MSDKSIDKSSFGSPLSFFLLKPNYLIFLLVLFLVGTNLIGTNFDRYYYYIDPKRGRSVIDFKSILKVFLNQALVSIVT